MRNKSKKYISRKKSIMCVQKMREKTLFLCADQDRSIDRCGSFLRHIPSITYLNSPAYICIKSMPADVCGSEFLCFNSKSRNEKFLYTLSINFLECEFSTSTYLSLSPFHTLLLSLHIRMLLS